VFFGFILLMAITFAVPDVQGTLDAVANAVVYIWTTSLGNAWAEFLLLIAVVAQFFCGTASVTSASRMMFAFSRDRAVPGSRLWRKVARNRVPVNAVLAIGVLSWLIMVPSLFSLVAYLVATSIAVIGLNIASPLPIILHPLRQQLRVRCLEPRSAPQVDLPARRGLDRVHLRRRHPARLSERGAGSGGVQLGGRQLLADHRRRRGGPLRRLVPDLGPQVVHRPGARGRQ
jgi:hypothetical protein